MADSCSISAGGQLQARAGELPPTEPGYQDERPGRPQDTYGSGRWRDGHWLDYGQKHHFMRRFDGQSPLEAYQESVQWIRTNVLSAAGKLADRIRLYFPKDELPGVSHFASTRLKCNVPAMSGGCESDRRCYRVFGSDLGHALDEPPDQPNWLDFGNAIHALQDSFSEGHVIRGKPLGKAAPGLIEYIKVDGPPYFE